VPSLAELKKSPVFIVVIVIIIAGVAGAVGYLVVYPMFDPGDDDDGDNDNKTTKNRRPYARFSVYYAGLFPVIGEEIWFNASQSSDPNGDALTYTWDFDDEVDLNGDENYRNDNQRQGMNVSWTYNVNGTYLVTLTVNDSKLSDTYVYTLVVRIATENNPPIVILSSAGKKEGLTGRLYLVTIGSANPLYLAVNYSIIIYDVEDENVTFMYESTVGNLTGEGDVVYRDIDNDDYLSQGDTFSITPSGELPADDGDLFVLLYGPLEVGIAELTSFGL
jgi:hypothetical protein